MDLPIKLISTDFDETIFSEFESPHIHAGLIELIARLQSQGVKWVINTGREMASLMESLDQARLPIQPDYLVVVEREIHERRGSWFAPVARWNQLCADEHRALFARVAPDVVQLEQWITSRYEASVYGDPHSPLCVIASNNQDMDEIHARLDAYCGGQPGLAVVRNDVYARFSHHAYDKGTALAEITRMVGADRRHVFAVGDHLNDLPMLQSHRAGYLAAPSNSVSAVRNQVAAQGGYVCRQPCGLGVQEALEFFLGHDHMRI